MPTYDVSAVWTDKDALLREWSCEETQSVTPRQQSHQQPAVRGDEQERATTATTVAERSTVGSASTARPFALDSPPPSARPASPGESTQGDATPTPGRVPGVNLSSRHAPCEPISEEQIAAMGWDATERSFAFYHQTVWRRFCNKYGHAKVHSLATERGEDTPRADTIVLPEDANGWLAGVGITGPPSVPFDTTEYDPLYPSYEEFVAEDNVPPVPTLSDDSFWRLYWESQASQAASEPLRFVPEYAAPTWYNVLPSPHRRPANMQMYNAPLAVLEASGLQAPFSCDTVGGHGHAALASTAAELDAHSRPAVSTGTVFTEFGPLAGPYQVDWLQGTQNIAARDANAIRGTHSGVEAGVQLPFPAHFDYEGYNVASMSAVGMPLRSPTTVQYPEALTAAAVFEALGIEMAGGYWTLRQCMTDVCRVWTLYIR